MIDRYSNEAMARIWTDQRRYELWLEVELAACAAMEEEGVVPAGTAAEVRAKARIDAARILEIEASTRHDVIAFLTAVEESAGPAARWLHFGMTSSDVLDTAFSLQLGEAGALILGGLDGLIEALGTRAREHRDTPVIGRSHGIHAEPTSLGLVFGSFHAEMTRTRRRLDLALEGLRTGKISGAVGNYANLVPSVEARALAALGLQPETVATQVVPRDRHAELFCALAILGGGLERIAITIRHWQRTEVGEAEEAFGAGQKGSSAMPHKRNPILSENLTGLARLLRHYAGAALENQALWHERDISHSSVERVIAPDATIVADFALGRLTRLIRGLRVKPEAMLANLNRTGGLVFSERLMLALVATGLPRQEAYVIVQRSAMAALEGKGEFRALLQEDPEVLERLGLEGVAAAFDLGHHLRHVPFILERAGLGGDAS
ncbi:MAG: adenylosuccinate lyase [Polyangia bacterium]|jgi:adenylosuccinate lyase|nr:adenylosuccinate lyase [Polyangia bacterium]